MKNRLSKLILCFAALSFTLSCEKEVTVEQMEQEADHSHVEMGDFLDYPELSNILKGLDIKNENGKYLTEKDGKQQEVKIDSSEVSKYKNGSVETYTLRVETKKNGKEKGILENLVLRKDPEGYSGFILRYHLTKDYLKELRDNKRAAMRAHISMERVNVQSLTAKQSCTYVTVPTCSNPGFDGDGAYVGSNGEHIRTDRCTNASYFTTETFSVCTDSSDDCNGCYYFDGTVTGGGGDPTMTGGSTGITSTPASEYDEDVVVTQPSGFQNMFVSLAETINEKLGNSLSPEELSFLVAFYDFALEANQFMNDNGNSNKSKNFIDWVIDFQLLPQTPCGVGHDCVKSIKHMAEGLRKLHGEEGVLMADYFDSLVVNYNSFTLYELQGFYDTAKAITDRYNDLMFVSIVGGFAEGVTPIVEIALFEMGLPVAVKLFQKIPISWVYRGVRLNSVVRKVGLLGKQGFNNTIREVVTNSPVTKARELFNSLTKHAISKTTKADGAIVADMGSGNFITYRPITASGSNVPATISLDFKTIWSKPRQVKFLNQ
ncbi:hypothetical protein [Croceivirga sp. JEA036]|uniref:hypothetical protein n=1 Tax=Croceivirga sp. JEA036 TaxID=2721162 RepID=UPI00143914DD|nr:hypothetical protein [Croceivirga sp. JEA036]NJB38197.1 hypothetical protein [Croceivirga sp. JEA036]